VGGCVACGVGVGVGFVLWCGPGRGCVGCGVRGESCMVCCGVGWGWVFKAVFLYGPVFLHVILA
jgi:hypothetical protein